MQIMATELKLQVYSLEFQSKIRFISFITGILLHRDSASSTTMLLQLISNTRNR